MQLLGKDLSHYFRTIGNLTNKSVCLIGQAIIRILKVLHSKGIIHRDVKPENIIYQEAAKSENSSNYQFIDMGVNNIFLIDFGTASIK